MGALLNKIANDQCLSLTYYIPVKNKSDFTKFLDRYDIMDMKKIEFMFEFGDDYSGISEADYKIYQEITRK